MAEVDSLEIQIESNAKSAFSALDELEKKLKNVSDMLNTIGKNEGLKQLSNAAKEATKGFSGIQSNMKKISQGMEPGVKKTFKSLDELKEQFKDLGTDFKYTGSTTAIEKQIKSYSNSLEKAKLRQKDLELSGKTSGKGYADAVKNVIKFSNLIKSLKRQLDEMKKSESMLSTEVLSPKIDESVFEDIKKASKNAKDFKKSMKDASGSVNGWEKLSKATESITKAFGMLKTGAKGTISAIKKLGTGFSGLYSIIRKMSSAVANLFSNVIRLASKATNAVIGSIKGITNAFSRLKGESSGISGATTGIKNLIKTAGGLLAAKGIVDFGKSAVSLGSDITEVENVVDTAFGSMEDKAYDFAKNAAAQFGLSELAAKQYSGTMMAMLKSSGVAQGAAADMSVTLAGLAGDLASFYNIDTDEAFRKLRAGISGETEPLKQLGINMNIVNLEAYAMSQGITKAYKDMTLAEQSILRYNYILAKTGDAQNDFARTSNSFANQVRLLRLNIQSLSAIIGQGLIAAILPAIKVLNKLMEKLMQAAKVFRDFMYVLTGNKIQSSQKGIVNDLASTVDYGTDLSGIGDSADNIADGMEEAASGTDDFTSSAKKLKKQLATLSFDELNQLPGKLDDLGDISSTPKLKTDKLKDLGLDDLNLGDMDGMFDSLGEKEMITPINKWAEAIRKAFLNHDWEGLGKTIAEMLNTGLEKVYKAIKDITPKVESALRAFARTFNSFIEWFDWDLLGRTIGAGVNLLVKAFNTLFDPQKGLNLEGLGKGLSKSFRGMVQEIEWRELGNALGNGFMIAWRIASGFIEDMWRIDEKTLLTGWAETGIALAEAVHGIFEKINFAQIGLTLANGFNGLVEIIRNFRNQMASNQTWSMIGQGISEGLNNVIDNINLKDMAHEISGLVLDVLRMLNDAAETTHWEDFGYKVAEALLTIPWLDLFNGVFDLVEATFGRALGGFVNYLTTHAEQLGMDFANMFNSVFARVKHITENIPWPDIATGISTFLNASIANIQPVEASQSLGKFVTDLLGTMLQVAQETNWNELGQKIGDFLINIPWATIIGQVFDTITAVFGGLITGLGGKILEKMPEIGTALADGFNHAFDTLKMFVDSMEGHWTEIGHTIATGLNNMITGIDWKTAGQTFGNFVKGIVDTIFTVAQETDWVAFGEGIADFLQGVPWLEILGKVFVTLKTVIGGLLEGLKETTAGKVLAGIATIWLKLKLFDLKGKVTDLVTKIGQAFGLLPKGVTDTAPGVSGGVTQIGGLFGKLLPAASGLISKIGPILGKLGTVIFSPKGAIIAAIIAAVALIVLNWDKIKEAAGAVKDWVADKWEALKEKTSEIWGNVTEFLGNAWEGLKESASTIFGNIKDAIADKFESIREVASNVWDEVSSKLGSIWDSLKTTAGNIWDKITGKVSDSNRAAEEDTTTAWGRLKDGFGQNLSDMDLSTSTAMASMSGTIGSSMAEISATYISGWNNMAGASSVVLQHVQAEITMMMQNIKGIIMVSMQEIGAIFYSGWQGVATMSAVAIEQISAGVTARMMAMQAVIGGLMQQIAGTFSNAWTAIGTMSFMATERMLQDVTVKMNVMNATVANAMNAMQTTFNTKWGEIKVTTTQAVNEVESAVKTKMDSSKRTVETSMRDMQTAFDKWKDMSKTCEGALKNIESSVNTKMDSVKRVVESSMKDSKKAFDKWKDMSKTCADALKDAEREVSAGMGSMKTTVEDSMKKISTAYKNGLKDFPSTARDTVGDTASEFEKLPNKISNALSGLYGKGQDAAQSFANGFKSVRIPVPHLRVASWTQHQSGNSIYSTPNYEVNWYAKGGLAYNPSVVGIGEAGPEAILPLENKRTMGMIADSITENQSSGIDENMLANAVAEGVAMALMNNIDNLSGGSPKYIQNSISLDGDVLIRAVTKAQDDYDYRMNPTPRYGY